jgi:hypothetical protein
MDRPDTVSLSGRRLSRGAREVEETNETTVDPALSPPADLDGET